MLTQPRLTRLHRTLCQQLHYAPLFQLHQDGSVVLPFFHAHSSMPTFRTEPSLGKGSCKTRRMMVLAIVGTPKDSPLWAASAPLVITPADWSALMSRSVIRA